MKVGLFKFVEVNGAFRFYVIEIWCPSHKTMLKPGETATAAGVISLRGNEAVMSDSYSSTLNVSTDEGGWERLSKALGVPIKARWEDYGCLLDL